jgi:hypothetical protein
VRGLWPLVKTAVGVGILVGLVVRLGAQAFVDGLAAIGAGSVLAALALGLLTTVASAARWCLVARGVGLRLPLAAAVSDCYRAVFLNSVLPAGVLGDVHRAVGYGRRIGDMGRGVRVVALERVTGQLAIVVVGLGVLLTARPTLLMALLPGRLGIAEMLAGFVALAAAVLWMARDPPPGSAPRCGRPASTRGPGSCPGRHGRACWRCRWSRWPATSPCSSSRPGSRDRKPRSATCCRCSSSGCWRWRCRSTSAGGVRAKG